MLLRPTNSGIGTPRAVVFEFPNDFLVGWVAEFLVLVFTVVKIAFVFPEPFVNVLGFDFIPMWVCVCKKEGCLFFFFYDVVVKVVHQAVAVVKNAHSKIRGPVEEKPLFDRMHCNEV